ncbi:MAG: hypothetical protein J6S75_12090, partial [Thermoguttaceae bacterium]|nr:hypothetical protein [Thermoguttaceae bacterium]
MTKKNNQSRFYNSHRPIDGGNLLVAKIQALRAKIKTLPTGSPELESLKAHEEGLKTELYYKIERLLEKAAGTLYKKVKNLSPCLEPKDFVQEAALGFLRAIDQFDLNQGTKFSTLVCRYGMT